MPAVRGARPIVNSELTKFHKKLQINSYPTLEEYTNVWREWINYSTQKSLVGLDKFTFADYTQGTSQTFDQFILRHSKDETLNFSISDSYNPGIVTDSSSALFVIMPMRLTENMETSTKVDMDDSKNTALT